MTKKIYVEINRLNKRKLGLVGFERRKEEVQTWKYFPGKADPCGMSRITWGHCIALYKRIMENSPAKSKS